MEKLFVILQILFLGMFLLEDKSEKRKVWLLVSGFFGLLFALTFQWNNDPLKYFNVIINSFTIVVNLKHIIFGK